MVTVAISDENRKRLLAIAADLQKETGRRVDPNEVIGFLIEAFERSYRKIELFRLFCRPVAGVSFKDLYAELVAERSEDERRPLEVVRPDRVS